MAGARLVEDEIVIEDDDWTPEELPILKQPKLKKRKIEPKKQLKSSKQEDKAPSNVEDFLAKCMAGTKKRRFGRNSLNDSTQQSSGKEEHDIGLIIPGLISDVVQKEVDVPSSSGTENGKSDSRKLSNSSLEPSQTTKTASEPFSNQDPLSLEAQEEAYFLKSKQTFQYVKKHREGDSKPFTDEVADPTSLIENVDVITESESESDPEEITNNYKFTKKAKRRWKDQQRNERMFVEPTSIHVSTPAKDTAPPMQTTSRRSESVDNAHHIIDSDDDETEISTSQNTDKENTEGTSYPKNKIQSSLEKTIDEILSLPEHMTSPQTGGRRSPNIFTAPIPSTEEVEEELDEELEALLQKNKQQRHNDLSIDFGEIIDITVEPQANDSDWGSLSYVSYAQQTAFMIIASLKPKTYKIKKIAHHSAQVYLKVEKFDVILSKICEERKLDKTAVVLVHNGVQLYPATTPHGLRMDGKVTISLMTKASYTGLQKRERLLQESKIAALEKTRLEEEKLRKEEEENARWKESAPPISSSSILDTAAQGASSKAPSEITIRIKFNHKGLIDGLIVKKNNSIAQTIAQWQSKHPETVDKQVVFSFDGEKLKAEASWSSIDVEDEDMVEVRLEG